MTKRSATNPGNLKLASHDIVNDLLERQDIVLHDLDELNHRVEAMIKELSDERQSEFLFDAA